MEQEKVLLNVEETAAYLNLGMTKTRELMKENEKIFCIHDFMTGQEYHYACCLSSPCQKQSDSYNQIFFAQQSG